MKVTLINDVRLQSDWQSAMKIKFGPEDDCGVIADQLAIPPLAYPTIYSLELTPSCNNRCSGCSNVFIQDKETRLMSPVRRPMPIEQWGVILDKIVPHAQTLKLTGGEATSHPQFEQIVGLLRGYGVPFTLFTNGRWQDPECLISLLSETPECQGLLVSLHGAEARAHEAFTGVKGSFEETVRNIGLATLGGLTVHTNTVFTRYNVRQIEATVALSQSLGAQCAVFNRYVGQPVPELEVPVWALMQAIREVDRLGRKKGQQRTKFGTCIPLCFVDSSSRGCLAGTAYCTIDPWGNVRPCNHAPQIAGNLLTQSLTTVWRSATMDAWRDLVPDECETCSAFSACHGGCRADAVLKGVKRDPLMTIPLQAIEIVPPQPKIEPLSLSGQAIPRLEYKLTDTNFGPVLVKGSDIIPLSPSARPILAAIEQPLTLRQLEQTFGNDSLELIGELYRQNALSLRAPL